jgi:hypothetical protein
VIEGDEDADDTAAGGASRLHLWSNRGYVGRAEARANSTGALLALYYSKALFRFYQNSNFLYSLSITSILGYMHEAVNVYKKITNCTV